MSEQHNSAGLDPNAWMYTASDLVFLLITFFVLLIAISAMDNKKIRESFSSLEGASGVIPVIPAEIPGTGHLALTLDPLVNLPRRAKIETSATPQPAEQVQHVRKFLQAVADALSGQPIQGSTLKELAEQANLDVRIEKLSTGYALTLPGRLLFSAGDNAVLEPDGERLIADTATILRVFGGSITVCASWSWRHGPQVLDTVIRALEKNRVASSLIEPELSSGAQRNIRFVLKERK